MAIDVEVKKWGNSFGIVLPKDFVDRNTIHENEVISLQIVKKADITQQFGTLKSKVGGQEFKDLVRKGWMK